MFFVNIKKTSSDFPFSVFTTSLDQKRWLETMEMKSLLCS